MVAIHSLMNSEKRIRNDILNLQQRLSQADKPIDEEPIIEKTKEVCLIESEPSPEDKIDQIKFDKHQRIMRKKEAQDAQRRFENEWLADLIKKIEQYI